MTKLVTRHLSISDALTVTGKHTARARHLVRWPTICSPRGTTRGPRSLPPCRWPTADPEPRKARPSALQGVSSPANAAKPTPHQTADASRSAAACGYSHTPRNPVSSLLPDTGLSLIVPQCLEGVSGPEPRLPSRGGGRSGAASHFACCLAQGLAAICVLLNPDWTPQAQGHAQQQCLSRRSAQTHRAQAPCRVAQGRGQGCRICTRLCAHTAKHSGTKHGRS